MSELVELSASISPTISFAMQHNAVPVIHAITVKNISSATIPTLVIRVTSNPSILSAREIQIQELSPGDERTIQNPDVRLLHSALSERTEASRGFITLTAYSRHQEEETELHVVSQDIEVLAFDHWQGMSGLPELIASFSQPNAASVAKILREADDLLKARFPGSSLSGYQVRDESSVWNQVWAIYSAVMKQRIAYINPPASFTDYGQRIRTPDRVMEERLGTCIDLVMLFASCAQQAGLRPVVLLKKGHAWLGIWRNETVLTTPTVVDPQIIRKRVDAGELFPIECTVLTTGSSVGLDQAYRLGHEHLSEQHDEEFTAAIDLEAAARSKIKPLPLRGVPVVEVELDPMFITVPPPPPPPELLELNLASATVVADPLARWKSQLLDLSGRNKLLNFKNTASVLEILHSRPWDVEDLVADGKELKFSSLGQLVGNDPRSKDLIARRGEGDLIESVVVEAFRRNELVINTMKETVDGPLTELYLTAKNAEQEGGANTLFMVCGVLTWKETQGSKAYRAPLIMVPVKLERKGPGNFRLLRHDDESFINPTLLHMLDVNFGFRMEAFAPGRPLPTDDFGINIKAILGSVRHAVADINGFEVRDETHLGSFSFAKFLMWRDLATRGAEIIGHPLVSKIARLDPAETSIGKDYSDLVFAPERDLDSKRAPNELFLVTSCDSSQEAAVHAAADGLSFVMEGPPGTGKSQTITNIIADALGRGKRVLFVSEKMAALSVVHQRLVDQELGDFVLELHNAKADKLSVINQLARPLGIAATTPSVEWERTAAELLAVRNSLNAYVTALHKPRPNGLTVFEATGTNLKHLEVGAAELNWPDLADHTMERLSSLRKVVSRIEVLGAQLSRLDDTALALITSTSWTPSYQAVVERAANSALSSTAELPSVLQRMGDFLGITVDGSLFQLEAIEQLAAILTEVPQIPVHLLEPAVRQSSAEVLSQLGQSQTAMAEARAHLMTRYQPAILEVDYDAILTSLKRAMSTWWPLSWWKTFKVRSMMRPFTTGGSRVKADLLKADLPRVGIFRSELQKIGGLEQRGTALMGSLWKGVDTDGGHLKRAEDWLARFDAAVDRVNVTSSAPMTKPLRQAIRRAPREFESTGLFGETITSYCKAVRGFMSAVEAVADAARVPSDRVTGRRDAPDLSGRLAAIGSGWLRQKLNLRDWCTWRQIQEEAAAVGLTPFIDLIRSGAVPKGQESEYFEFLYQRAWLNRIVDNEPALASFQVFEHERRIQEFRQLDKTFKALTRQIIRARLVARVPINRGNAPAKSSLGVLLHEAAKKIRHKSVRVLFSEIRDLLGTLAPCMMMSPLSVAQYLDTHTDRFDLVIFDEASQIPTHDAIGVIARGEQLIVVGDPKQLPPTTFFAASDNQDSDEKDLESVLDQCMSVGMRVHRLKWHYRSLNEGLIAFSNNRYYQGQLITFPPPSVRSSGVHYHHTPGVYERSGKATNRGEAEALVAHVKRHVGDPILCKKSLGLLTFSKNQMDLVQSLLDAAQRIDTEFEANLSKFQSSVDEVFVRNLENVQGDERDVILFSICYGPDAAGNVWMNFGPLNKEGGERRLNVAATRAREEVHVYATLKPEQIDLNRTKARGVHDLKLYLEYAIRGPVALDAHAMPTGRAPDSPFEVQVISRLANAGWQVHPQVGFSGYRIDIGVVDPHYPGRYLLGVECDGATYHSAATARDRDMLRQEVLERLGWIIHRVWSTEWWVQSDREFERLATKLKMLEANSAEQKAVEMEIARVEESEREALKAFLASAPVSPDSSINAEGELASLDSKDVGLGLLAPYVKASLVTRDRTFFYGASELMPLAKMVGEVVEVEGPIAKALLIERIRSAYGMERSGISVVEQVELAMRLCPTCELDEHGYVWSKDKARETHPRALGDRQVDEIAPEERAALIKKVRSFAGTDEPEMLMRFAAKLLDTRFTDRFKSAFRP